MINIFIRENVEGLATSVTYEYIFKNAIYNDI